MIRRPPRSTRTDTLFPYTTLFRSARLRDFADAASDWFWEMDAELRFSFMSERLREVTGVDPCSTLGKTRQEIGAGDTDAEKWETHLADLSAHRPFREFRYIYRSEERRVGKECGSTFRSRWSPCH